MRSRSVFLLVCSLLVTALLTWAAFSRLHVETDIVRSMPQNDPVMQDAVRVFGQHPLHDQVALDVALDRPAPDQLVALGERLEAKMRASDLFVQVGNRELASLMPGLLSDLPARLPFLFSAEELARNVAPRLEAEAVTAQMRTLSGQLAGMDGIGQAGLIAVDPLNLRELVLARMAPLAPSQNAKLYRGQLLSQDDRHLLLTARPVMPGSDTDQARRLAAFFADAEKELTAQARQEGLSLKLTPLGAYRVALDNEEVVRGDVEFALFFSTVGIALLLLITFPRPWLGLLSLLPSLAGTAAALFVYSLFRDSISLLVLGFGGALISITVDYGITYLLLLDQPHATKGQSAADELKAIGGRVALFTTVSAFLVLGFSGFAMFAELGLFTALGFLFTYLFVVLVFPQMFVELAPGPKRALPLHHLVDWLGRRGWLGAGLAALMFCCLLPFAWPRFHISLQDMGSSRPETQAAERVFTDIWGDMGSRVYLMRQSGTLSELAAANDQLCAHLEEDRKAGRIASFFAPAMLFPGEKRAASQLAAWHAFWTPERRASLREHLATAGAEAGFAADAFAPFLRLLEPDYQPALQSLAPDFFPLLSINSGEGQYIQFIAVEPGPHYQAGDFFARYSGTGLARIFDGPYFAERLGDLLAHSFIWGLALIVGLVAVFHLLFSLSPRLTLLTLLPSTFALVCTLGTLKLLGQPLNLPALMLAIVIFGMGDDYAVYTVYGYQWHRNPRHSSYLLARATVFLSAASTLIGFGVLCFASHPLLKSVGLTSVLGVGYSLLGANLLLPPLLKWTYRERSTPPGLPLVARVRERFRLLEAYPRVFARCKLAIDPMFQDLPQMLAHLAAPPRRIYDIGCGYGVPACWLLERFPEARLYGVEPDARRVRVAGFSVGGRGEIRRGWATDAPFFADNVNLVVLLDMLHYLDESALRETLTQAAATLEADGLLLIRHSQKPAGPRSWRWHLEDWRTSRFGQAHYHERAMLAAMAESLGFAVLVNEPTANDPELAWFLARRRKAA